MSIVNSAEPAADSANRPNSRCAAYWCHAPALRGSVLCRRHDDLLTTDLRSQLYASIAGAVAHVAAAQMRVAFERLPKDVRDRVREDAKKL